MLAMCHFSVYLRSSFTVQYATALYVAFAMQQIMIHVKMFVINMAVNNFLNLNNPFYRNLHWIECSSVRRWCFSIHIVRITIKCKVLYLQLCSDYYSKFSKASCMSSIFILQMIGVLFISLCSSDGALESL